MSQASYDRTRRRPTAFQCPSQQSPRMCTHSRRQIQVHHYRTSPLVVLPPVSHTRRIYKHRFPSPHPPRTSSPPPRGQFRRDGSPHQLDKLRPPRTRPCRVGTHGLERGLDVVPAHTFDTPCGMDVPKDMQPWTNAPKRRQKHIAPRPAVKMSQRRPVRQEHVNPGWYPGPERNGRMVCVQESSGKTGVGWAEARVLKGPCAVMRGVGTPVDTQGVFAHGHLHHVILEVRQRRVRLAYVRTCLGFRERAVVVPCDKHLDGVGLYAQPREGIAEFGECTRLGEVAGVEENVACWERWLCAVRVVGVRDADDADVGGRLLSGWGWNGELCPCIDTVCKEEQWGGLEVVQGCCASAMYE